MELNKIAEQVIGATIEVHKALGPAFAGGFHDPRRSPCPLCLCGVKRIAFESHGTIVARHQPLVPAVIVTEHEYEYEYE